MIKVFGAIDIFAGVIFLGDAMLNLLGINFIPNTLILIVGVFLLIKSAIFIVGLDINTILDLICGLIIIISLSVTIPLVIVSLVALFLVQKGFFSFVD